MGALFLLLILLALILTIAVPVVLALRTMGAWRRAVEEPGESTLPMGARKTGRVRCPYCHDDVRDDAGEDRVVCADCRAPQHSACWIELGACAACSGQKLLGLRSGQAGQVESEIARRERRAPEGGREKE